MRSLQIIFLILAIHLRGSSADLPGWLKKALESTKNGFATAWNATRTAVEKAWNATKSGTKKLWRSVKNGPSELFDSVKRKANETIAAVKEYAEGEWDSGADKFWLSKLYAKLLTNAVCLELIDFASDSI